MEPVNVRLGTMSSTADVYFVRFLDVFNVNHKQHASNVLGRKSLTHSLLIKNVTV